MKLSIGPAGPDRSAIASAMVYSAGPEMFEYMFSRGGWQARDFLDWAWREGGGFFGCRNHAWAWHDGELLGLGSFYSGVEYPQMSRETVWQVLRAYPMRCWPGMVRDFLHIGRWTPAPARSVEYVANLGVAEAARGMGVGSALLEHHRQRAVAWGKVAFALDVADNNPRAQALYERLGFALCHERAFGGPDRGIPIPKVRRLMMPLV